MWPLALATILALLADQPVPYQDFSKSGAGFYGSGRELPDPVGLRSIRIGVLGPEKDAIGIQQRAAIEMALEEANQRGGFHPGNSPEIPYEMVFRGDDGPWGVAANQVVKMIYEDQVWTIIGGLDGQHTHAAELVVAKAWVPVISPAAIDSTIEYANVPWVFRVAPSDSTQAEALLTYARDRGYRELAVLSETQRDAYSGFKRLEECSRKMRFPLASHLEYSTVDPEAVVPRLRNLTVDGVIVWGSQDSAVVLIQAIRNAGIRVPVLGPSSLATPEMALKAPKSGRVVAASPFDFTQDGVDLQGFIRRFEKRTGTPATWVAASCYDVARLVIESIESAGLNRARIRDGISGISFQGLTGRIGFNQLGGNDSRPVLMSLEAGRWVSIKAAIFNKGSN
ncbi:MAG TPA: ABC transporter substrate-binding protein [Terriglobia bacterium]|nr:ABC transporter substrate-binding protein [Terriglobia bacterium]